jgi:hypothetical protein
VRKPSYITELANKAELNLDLAEDGPFELFASIAAFWQNRKAFTTLAKVRRLKNRSSVFKD